MGVDVGTATGYLDLDISGFLAGLRSAQSEAQKTTSNMATQIGNGFQGVGKTLTSMGSTLTKSVTTPIVGLGTAIVKTSADFESSMSKVQAISGVTGDDFDKLNQKAREMGSKTKFSASEAAEAFQYMAMAGWDVDSMLGGISGVMNLAAASGENLGTVSDIVTDAMTAFGLSAKETSKVLKDGVQVEVDNTTRFVDALAAASNSSNTNVAMLGESFKYVAPVAGALGYTIEDTAIALGLMANQGIKASQSGTALRTLLTNMANPTDTMASAMDALGVSLENDDGSMKSLMEVLQDLRKGFGQGHMDADEFTKSMTELQSSFDEGKISEDEYAAGVENLMVAMYGAEGAQKAQLAAQLAGKSGMAGLLAIVNTGEEDFNDLADSIYNASGTSQEMADIMNDNLSGQITIMLSALQELALQFGEVLVPVIKEVVEWLQGLITKLQEMSPEQKEQVVKWAAIAAAIGPVILVIGKLITSVGSIITAFEKIPGMITNLQSGFGLLKAAIGGVSAPVVAIVAVIATLVAAFKHLWETNEEFREKITAIWDGLKSKFEEFGQGIVDRLNALGFDFQNITEVLSAIWNGFCEILAPVFEAAFQIVSDVLGGVLDVITGILDIFIGLFTGNWEQCWNGVKEVFGGIWDAIVGVFTGVMDALKGVADVVLGWFGTSWEEVWTSVKTFFVNIWTGIKSFFEGIVNGIKTFASNAWNAIKTVTMTVFSAISNFFSTIWNAIKTVVTTVVKGIKNTINTVWNTIKTIIETVMNGIKAVITNVWNAIKTTISTVINGIKSTLGTVWNAIKTTITNVVNGIKTVITNVWNAIKTTISNVVDGIKTKVTTVFEAIKTSVSTIFNAVKTTVTTIWNGIKTTITNVVDGIKTGISTALNTIETTWSNIWNSIKTTTSTIFDAIWTAIKTPINSILGGVESMVNGVIKGINLMIDALNSLSFDVPDWVPAIGGETFGFNIGKLSTVSLPRLAKGAVIPGGNPFVAILGDQPKGQTNIEAPLATIKQAVREEMSAVFSELIMIGRGMYAATMMLVDMGRQMMSDGLGYVGRGGANGRNQDMAVTNLTDKSSQGGRTYVFYSDKPIDEIQAARLMRKTERDIAEGFV